MHWFVAALLGPLLALVDSFVGRVILALGLSFVTYNGITAGLDWILQTVVANLGSADSVILGIMGVLRIDQVVTILLSAIATRLSINGMADGVRALVRK